MNENGGGCHADGGRSRESVKSGGGRRRGGVAGAPLERGEREVGDGDMRNDLRNRHRLPCMSYASGWASLWLIPVLLVGSLLATFLFFEGRKAYWDYRVREMCTKDGGVKINQTIDVDTRTYESLKNKFGKLDIPRSEDPNSAKSIAVHSYKDVYIRRSNPEVRRSEISVSRVANGVVVATSTTYSRVGGDLLALHSSYFSCPSVPEDFFASIFNLKDGNK